MTCLGREDAEEETSTLEVLVTQCKQAAAAGRFFSSDKAKPNSVHVWSSCVSTSLPAKAGDEETGQSNSSIVKKYFGIRLTKLLLQHPCYEDLHESESVYQGLENKGVVSPKTAAALRRLLAYQPDSTDAIAPARVDQKTQVRLFTPIL